MKKVGKFCSIALCCLLMCCFKSTASATEIGVFDMLILEQCKYYKNFRTQVEELQKLKNGNLPKLINEKQKALEEESKAGKGKENKLRIEKLQKEMQTIQEQMMSINRRIQLAANEHIAEFTRALKRIMQEVAKESSKDLILAQQSDLTYSANEKTDVSKKIAIKLDAYEGSSTLKDRYEEIEKNEQKSQKGQSAIKSK